MVTGQLIDSTATPYLFSGLVSLDFVLEFTCPVLKEGPPPTQSQAMLLISLSSQSGCFCLLASDWVRPRACDAVLANETEGEAHYVQGSP